MAEVDIFKGKIKLSHELNNVGKEIFEQRIETKLSLRKKAVDNILYNKRILGNAPFDFEDKKIKWKLLYDIKNINFQSDESKLKFKLIFEENDDEKILSEASKYLKSENLDDIKYGIILIQTFIKRNMNDDLTNSINLLFVYELFHIIEKMNKEDEIIFNILDIIITYSSFNKDKALATILLSPESYKIWELCFNLQNFDIFYEIICVLNNIIQNNTIGGCNLIRSNFLKNNIYNFYTTESIISQKDNQNKYDINYYIIKDGINLICSLLIIPTVDLDKVTKSEVILSKQKLIKILLLYYDTNCFDNYLKCIYAFNLAVGQDLILFEELEKNDFFENILINKKFFEEKQILFYLNELFGNYIAYSPKISYKLLEDLINFEAYYLKICKDFSHRKNIFWTLSNILLSNDEIFKKIFEVENLLSNIFNCLKHSYSSKEAREILYLFSILFLYINNKYFIELEKNHLMELVIFHAKNNFENNVDGLYICFTILEFYLIFGKNLSKYFDGKNLIKEKFYKLGGNELLEKYINFPDENLAHEIINIYKNF